MKRIKRAVFAGVLLISLLLPNLRLESGSAMADLQVMPRSAFACDPGASGTCPGGD